MRFEWDVLWQLSGGDRLVTMAGHSLSSYLMVGTLSAIHMRASIRS